MKSPPNSYRKQINGLPNIPPTNVARPIVPTSAADIGDRLILSPLETHPTLDHSSLRQFIKEGQSFDAIVLDPPKFAPTPASAERAARAYKDINRLALKLLNPGGLLMTFSCSGGVSAGRTCRFWPGDGHDHVVSADTAGLGASADP